MRILNRASGIFAGKTRGNQEIKDELRASMFADAVKSRAESVTIDASLPSTEICRRMRDANAAGANAIHIVGIGSKAARLSSWRERIDKMRTTTACRRRERRR